jgi:hypothetical protein
MGGGESDMIKENEIRQRLLEVVSGRLNLDDFEDWLVSHSWNMHLDSPREAQELVWAIELALAEHSNGHLSSQALQEQLKRLLAQTTWPTMDWTATNIETKIVIGEAQNEPMNQFVSHPALDNLAVTVEIQPQGAYDFDVLDLPGHQTNRFLLIPIPT